MDRLAVHRYVAATPRRLASVGPSAHKHCARTVGLNQGILLRVSRDSSATPPGGRAGSYDITGKALERYASHPVAGFLAGWAG